MRYFFDLKQSIIRGLKVEQRHAQIIAWLYSILYPLESLYEAFIAYVLKTNYKAAFTGQVVYLEHYLNDYLDPVQRRIFITDGEFEPSTFVFFDSEGVREPYIYFANENDPQEDYLIFHSDISGRVDFYINMPIRIGLLAGGMAALVEPFKLAGKTWSVKRFV